VRSLVLAADRSARLTPTRAATFYERALALVPPMHDLRPHILTGLARVLEDLNQHARSMVLLEEAIPAFREASQPARAFGAQVRLASVGRVHDPSPRNGELLEEAITGLEGLPLGEELIDAYSERATAEYVADHITEAVRWAGKALTLAERLSSKPPVGLSALRIHGAARGFTGDIGGIEDLRKVIDLATGGGYLRLGVRSRNELSLILGLTHGPSAALAELDAGLELVRRSGMPEVGQTLEIARTEPLFEVGRWDEALDAERLTEFGELVLKEFRDYQITCCTIHIWRGDLASADVVAREIDATARAWVESQEIIPALAVLAHLAVARRDLDLAASLLRELEGFPDVREAWNYANYLPEVIRSALAAVDVGFAESLTTGLPDPVFERGRVSRLMAQAEVAEARGEFERAAELYSGTQEGWRTFSIPESAQSLLGRGRCLLAQGDPLAEQALLDAAEAFRSLGARRFLAEVDILLERAGRRTS
jgi:tetratricopeptide (TPR) repeat protein